jgi:phenylacetate-CoA ligase
MSARTDTSKVTVAMPAARLRGPRKLAWTPALEMADGLQWAALRWGPLFRALGTSPSGFTEKLSAPAALRAAEFALARVPAYRSFVDASGWRDRPWSSAADRVRALPETDKASYIKAYSTAERCVDGVIPDEDVEIDESSGSSGTPYSWVRSAEELHDVHLTLSQLARHLLGRRIVTVNGFSMGAWATGTNVSKALAHNGIIKSTGPDPEKILSALDLLGRRYTYVITGYPPFLRELLEYGEAHGFDWRRYRMFGVVGGEGMSELLRARLEERFVAIYSAYGASDLDIGVAGEFPLSVAVRKRAAEDPGLASALFGDARRLPMLFQYNPLDYFVESNAAGELVVTVNRLSMLSPRIRYNIHDEGGALPYARVLEICREFGFDPVAEVPKRPFKLPFLYVRGRSDSTLSYMGANIYPEDVEQALFRDFVGRDAVSGFAMELVENEAAEVRPCVHVEAAGAVDAGAIAACVRERLMANSRDFKAAVAEDPRTGDIVVRLHRPGEGPFAENSRRIKRRYVIKD